MNKDEYGDFVLRYKGCGACFPMYHNLSRFEKMWFTAIQKDVADLEKENAELKEQLENDRDLPAIAYMQGAEKQKKKDEEELKNWKDEWQEQVQKATDEGYARTLQTIQLSKAKDILKYVLNSFVGDLPRNLGYFDEEELKAIAEAEQFLNSEVEK